MNCDAIENLLNGMLDSELDDSERQTVERHLEYCVRCRRLWRELQDVDDRLTATLRLIDKDERIAAIHASPRSAVNAQQRKMVVAPTSKRSSHRLLATAVFLSVSVAGLLLLMLGYGPSSTTATPAGTLVQVTGQVELRDATSDEWRSVVELTDLRCGTQLRTGLQGLCEIETTNLSRIRVDQQAHLVVHDPGRVELRGGTLWCAASATSELVVEVCLTAENDQPVWLMTCPSSSEFQWSANGNAATCVAGQDSASTWTCGPQHVAIAPGDAVSVTSQRVMTRVVDDEATFKIWQLPLLAKHQQELHDVLQPVLASVGMTKARYLSEDQIRRLGPPGAIALLAFVESSKEPSHAKLRETAMRLAVETCDTTAFPALRRIQKDADATVAQLASERLAQP